VKVAETDIPGVVVITPQVFDDRRGFFMESYNRRRLSQLGIKLEFVQDNHSRSDRGVLRGLHYQIGHPQAKLVRVTRGRVYDVVADIRKGSPTFGQWFGIELTAENKLQLFAPEGLAHGFLVLSETAEFQYKCSDYFSREDERGLPWDDPSIDIQWPLDGLEPILSDRDKSWSPLSETPESDLPEFAW
jgi:dTDP-4-dehydrorhamnose 3,5-epimerase